MKCSYAVGSEESGEKLYCLPDGKLSYGKQHELGEPVHIVSDGNVSFLVAGEKILNVIKFQIDTDTVSVCELSTRLFLSSNPSKADIAGSVSFSREKANAWEKFELQALEKLPSWLDVYFSIFDGSPLDNIFELVALGESVDNSVLTYIIESSDRKYLDEVIRKRVVDKGFLKNLLVQVAGNYLISPLLKEVIEGKLDNIAPIKVLGKDKDIYGRGANVANPWVILNSSIRRNIKKSGKYCIVATARNEGVYLIEWIAYHLELGADKIFIYTNNNQDGSTELLRALHTAGFIELIESDVGEGGNAQVKAYTHALIANLAVIKYEWCVFIDVDEFLSFDTMRFDSFSDFLTWCGSSGADVIALSWILASNTLDCKSWSSELLTKRITKTSPFQSKLIKCVVRPETAAMSGPHYPLSANGCSLSIVNADRERYKYDILENPFDITCCAAPSFKNAYLYHFEMKSFPELLWKYSRNRGNYSAVTKDIYINEYFIGRIAHFRRCMETGASKNITLSVAANKINMKILEISSNSKVLDASEAVKRSTEERYEKLFAYLPEFLVNEVMDEQYLNQKDWVFKEFLKDVTVL